MKTNDGGNDRHETTEEEAERNHWETRLLKRGAEIIRVLDAGDGVELGLLYRYFEPYMSYQRFTGLLRVYRANRLVRVQDGMVRWMGPRRNAQIAVREEE